MHPMVFSHAGLGTNNESTPAGGNMDSEGIEPPRSQWREIWFANKRPNDNYSVEMNDDD